MDSVNQNCSYYSVGITVAYLYIKRQWNFPLIRSIMNICCQVSSSQMPLLSSVPSRTWMRHKEADVPGFPFSVRVIHGKIWVCHWNVVTVYDEDLWLCRTIPVNDMERVHDIATLAGDELVFAAQTGLYHMTGDGE